MNIDFPLILTSLVLLTGLIALFDVLFLAKKRAADKKTPVIIEYARSFFPILLLVLVIRSFVAEAFRIPTGSLKPTLLDGDFVLVNKYEYGLRLPVLNSKIVSIGEPKLGDIVVFRWPVDPSFNYIKRIVGVPGDHVQYINKQLFVNGKPAKQTFIEYTNITSDAGVSRRVAKYRENLQGVEHDIYIIPGRLSKDIDTVVPEGHYFAMGDNRDDSNDSRYWGAFPEHNLVGKAVAVLLSWDKQHYAVRWKRVASKIT